ncbi:MAG: hypothetical protein ACREQV_21375 [Candidatus Binatia bacterium]
MKSNENKKRVAGELAGDSQCSAEEAVLLGQGAYYLATGVWPLASLRTFESVTGPKTDKWLVKTVGVLVGVIGAALMLAGRRKAVSPQVRLLAAGSAVGLTAIEVTYVAKRRIAPVYLLDTLGEVAILMMLVWAKRQRKQNSASGTRANRDKSHSIRSERTA